MIRWVVFDAMGVVFPVADDTNDLLVPFIWERNESISREAVNAVYLPASRGEISGRQFWDEVGLGGLYPQVETTYLDTRLTVDPAFPPVARRLHERFSLGLLSNDVAEWSAYLRARHSLDFFDAVTISGAVHCRKPSAEIYERFLQDSGARAAECLFVDDRPKNLAAAAALGFATILFERQPSGDAVDGDFRPDGRVTGFDALERAIDEIAARS